jgi:dTDP-4-amino-4,6-dideoxygalactose transaminase
VIRPRIPFVSLDLGEDAAAVRSAIARVIESGWFVLGPEVDAFEGEFAAACGASHAIGVGSGTDALALTLRAMDIGAGDEVITTPLSAAYTALAVMMAGARPVFADIDPRRLTLDPDAVDEAVTARTRAVLPVHLYGQAADMPAIERLASRRGIAVIEDCCQAHLASCGGHPVGTFGAAGAFSFYPTKNLGALGDGGAVVTNDVRLAERIRRLRNGGQVDRYRHQEAGVNSRLDELQAAILRARLPFLARWTSQRRALAARYRTALDGGGIAPLEEVETGHVYHLFVVRSGRCPGRDRRAELQRHLSARGIETLVHYPVPITSQPAFATANPRDCPHATAACEEVVSLPLHPGLADRDIAEISGAVREFSRKDGE